MCVPSFKQDVAHKLIYHLFDVNNAGIGLGVDKNLKCKILSYVIIIVLSFRVRYHTIARLICSLGMIRSPLCFALVVQLRGTMLGWYSLSPDEETLGPSAHVSSFFFRLSLLCWQFILQAHMTFFCMLAVTFRQLRGKPQRKTGLIRRTQGYLIGNAYMCEVSEHRLSDYLMLTPLMEWN